MFPAQRYGLAAKVVVPIAAFESRLAFPGADDGDAEETEELPTPGRRFTLLEITSGLTDDSREGDERLIGRQLRELGASVKAARRVVATTPGLAETRVRDWRKAAWFCARSGITEGMFRLGVPRPGDLSEGNLLRALKGAPIDTTTESRARGDATLPAFPTG